MIDLRPNEKYFGFEVTATDAVKDINSNVYLLSHIKSGARVLLSKNDDENRVFFVSFKTPPENNCGTAHILEHSVLCGSEKFDIKDPFNELIKGSLNTYLNALTYSDKTVYPIASTNEKDFKNLTEVYLDAVFNPLIMKEKNIFLQEGWHYEIDDQTGELTYNGVVYNEMRGATSDPERILDNEINKSLFKTSCYRYDSGGDPDDIPNLTYEDFISFYKKYYHPSNSYIYVYGDINIEENLQMLNEYLDKYDRITDLPVINKESEEENKSFVYGTYSVTEKEKNSDYLSLNFITGISTDCVTSLGLKILKYILLDTEASPLKKALLEKKICNDIEGWFSSTTYDMVFSIVAKNSDVSKKDEFLNIIFDTLNDIVKNGIDKELAEGALNYFEFLIREGDYGYRPKGLFFGVNMMESWLHMENPIESLKVTSFLSVIRESFKNGYFENLIDKYILKNNRYSVVLLSAEEGKLDKHIEEQKLKLQNIKKELSKEQINDIILTEKNLKKYQEEPEPLEKINKIPHLSVEEISKTSKYSETEEMCIDNVKVLLTNLPTNGISYVDIVFDTKCIPQNLLPYTGLLAELLFKLSTKHYTVEEISKRINLYTGGVYAFCNVYNISNDRYESKFSVKGKTLSQNLQELFLIIGEVVRFLKFEDKESVIKSIRELKRQSEDDIISAPHVYSSNRCLSYFSEGHKINELFSGIEYYKFLSELEKTIDKNYDKFVTKMMSVIDILFCKNNMFISVCSEKKYFQMTKIFCLRLMELVKENSSYCNQEYNFNFNIKKEGFIIPSKVQYNSLAFNYKDMGFEYSGGLAVIKSILNRDYLWNNIRVKGGAYGSGFSASQSGNSYFYSYRDPKLKETFDVYKNTDKFLSELKLTKNDVDKYIIGTINGIDRPKGNNALSSEVIVDHILNMTSEKKDKKRNEILSFKVDDIDKFIKIFEMIKDTDYICTIGNCDMINSNKELYDRVENLV